MSQLQTLIKQINSAPNVRDALVIAQDRWEKNYYLVTGRKDGVQRFQSELLNYLDIINDKPELKKADNFSHFAAVMKAAVTGLSFRNDGHLYPIAYGGKIKVQVGAHGKREMLMQMKEIKFVNEAQLVVKGDTFKHDKINNRVVEHVSEGKEAKSLDDVVAAYTRLEYTDGKIVDVVVYHDELVKAKQASKNKGAGSVWDTWFGEMCKKVTYHRAKKLYHRYPEGIEFNVGDDEETSEPEDISYEVQDQQPESQPAEQVNQETGEVLEPEVVKPETTTKKEKKANPF